MSSNKKYRLLKDTPSEKAGDIYEQRSDRYINTTEHSNNSPVIESNSYFSWQVENNPEWFQLIPDNPEIAEEFDDREPYDKFECAVQKAINIFSLENKSDTPDYIGAEFLRKTFELFNKSIRERDRWYGKQLHSNTTEKKYTEKELLEAEERAFMSARKAASSIGCHSEFDSHAFYFPTFSDYKNFNK